MGKSNIKKKEAGYPKINKCHTNYPSRCSFGEKVTLDFNISGKIENCLISMVHFDIEKVYYDIAVPVIKKGRTTKFTTISNVDSCFISDSK